MSRMDAPQTASMVRAEHQLHTIKNAFMLWSEKDLNHGKGCNKP